MGWRQIPNGSYIQAGEVVHGFVEQQPDGKWVVTATLSSGEVLTVSPPFVTQVGAQTALDNFVAVTGGTV